MSDIQTYYTPINAIDNLLITAEVQGLFYNWIGHIGLLPILSASHGQFVVNVTVCLHEVCKRVLFQC